MATPEPTPSPADEPQPSDTPAEEAATPRDDESIVQTEAPAGAVPSTPNQSVSAAPVPDGGTSMESPPTQPVTQPPTAAPETPPPEEIINRWFDDPYAYGMSMEELLEELPGLLMGPLARRTLDQSTRPSWTRSAPARTEVKSDKADEPEDSGILGKMRALIGTLIVGALFFLVCVLVFTIGTLSEADMGTIVVLPCIALLLLILAIANRLPWLALLSLLILLTSTVWLLDSLGIINLYWHIGPLEFPLPLEPID